MKVYVVISMVDLGYHIKKIFRSQADAKHFLREQKRKHKEKWSWNLELEIEEWDVE